jgi:exosortase
MPTLLPAADSLKRARAFSPVPLLAVLAVLAGAVILYWPSVMSLIGQWSLGNYRHGWLVAILAITLLVRDRHRLSETPLQPQVSAAVLLCVVSIAWAIVLRANLQVGHQLLWPLIVFLAIAALLGMAIARVCAFAIGFIYFAIPIWDVLIPALQTIATSLVGLMLRASAIPAFISGNIIQVAAGDFQIVDGCSGLNFLIVALTVAALYGEVMRCTWRARLKFLVLGAGLALLGNWLRIYAIVVIGVASNMKSGLVAAHASLGWWLYAAVLAVFFGIAHRLHAPLAIPVSRADECSRRRRSAALLAATLGAIGLAGGPLLLTLTSPVSGARERSSALPSALPAPAAGWTQQARAAPDWQPVFHGADRAESATYQASSGSVEVFVARYQMQVEGRELVSTANSILGNGQRSIAPESDSVARPAALNQRLIEDVHHRRWVLWYGYFAGNRRFASGYAQALWYGLASLRDAPIAGVVATRAPCEPDCAGAQALLARFWRESKFHP